jgi:hypothetical protein
MSTQHLSVSITAYPDGEWAIALVRTTTHPGRPLTRQQLVVRKTDMHSVHREVSQALDHMAAQELERLESEGRRRPEHP